jgi:hypothetical protein
MGIKIIEINLMDYLKFLKIKIQENESMSEYEPAKNMNKDCDVELCCKYCKYSGYDEKSTDVVDPQCINCQRYTTYTLKSMSIDEYRLNSILNSIDDNPYKVSKEFLTHMVKELNIWMMDASSDTDAIRFEYQYCDYLFKPFTIHDIDRSLFEPVWIIKANCTRFLFKDIESAKLSMLFGKNTSVERDLKINNLGSFIITINVDIL